MAILSIATILRVLFLQNMEFKQDEMEMVHMAINLARDHIPYVVGNLTSHGNRNPPGFLYLLSTSGFDLPSSDTHYFFYSLLKYPYCLYDLSTGSKFIGLEGRSGCRDYSLPVLHGQSVAL